MASVTIDAGVLATPPECGCIEDTHGYVETLLEWGQLLDDPWVAVYMSERASESLLDDGLFPFREQLRRLFAANGLEGRHYNFNTVAYVVDRLLQLTPSFETYFSIRDVLAEEVSTEPDILRLCSGTKLQSDLARCVVLIAILRHHCQEPVCDHSLILRRAPGKTVKVRARIEVLEHERADLGKMPLPLEYFEGDVLVCDNFRGLTECLDEVAIATKATDDIGIETALRVGLYKARLARGMEPDWDDVPSHRIGQRFLSSLLRNCATTQLMTKAIRAVLETLEQSDMAATHWLRTGRGGGDPQRVRRSDRARAWRRDIDRDHHLHYWLHEDGTVELASVSFPHDDFTIPE